MQIQSSFKIAILGEDVQTGAPKLPIITGRLWFLLSPPNKLLLAFKKAAESGLRRPTSVPWLFLFSFISGVLMTLAIPSLFSLSTRFIFDWPISGGFLEGLKPYISCRNVSAGREARKFSERHARGSKGKGEGQGEWDGEFGGVEGTAGTLAGRMRGFSEIGLWYTLAEMPLSCRSLARLMVLLQVVVKSRRLLIDSPMLSL